MSQVIGIAGDSITDGYKLGLIEWALDGPYIMNPYGPAWVDSGNQDGPLMFLGGKDDTTTPTDSFEEVFYTIADGQGGLLAELDGGSHNSEAWGVDEFGVTLIDACKINVPCLITF